MAVGTDPLSIVYNRLWDLMEAYTGLTDLVKVGDRLKYNDWMAMTQKDVLGSGDLPELSIVPTGSSYGLQQTSNGTFLVESYEARLIVGDKRLAEVGGFLPVKWVLIRAFSGWAAKLLALTWSPVEEGPSYTFVVHAKPGEIVDAAFQEKGISGWVSFLRFNVTMSFKTAHIQP